MNNPARTAVLGLLCLSFAHLAEAAGKSIWMIDSPLPTIEALRGVATIGSTIVAVGNNGTVLNSTDGITWNRIPTALTDELWQLASSGKDLVIASNRMGVVWTSADGWNWIPRPTGLDGMMYWLNWCNGRYVGLATIAAGRGALSMAHFSRRLTESNGPVTASIAADSGQLQLLGPARSSLLRVRRRPHSKN